MEYISLISLWLPIVLSAVVVFVAAAIVWMVLPHHKTDWAGVPNEGTLLDAIRSVGMGPGQYVFPRAMTPEGWKDPNAKEQLASSPVGYIVLRESGPPNMGKSLVQYFIYVLFVSFMCAYVARIVLSPGTEYLTVFRVVGTVAFLAYAAAEIPPSIWFGRPWSVTVKTAIDGLVFGLLTGGVFGWLWP